MPAESQSQQRAAGMALAAKRGKLNPRVLKGAAKQMYKSMTADQLEEFASTERKGLPKKAGGGEFASTRSADGRFPI